MKIVCVIDHLGAGGAQRQLATLAVLLKRIGHAVSLVTYHKDDFFGPLLQQAGIRCESLGRKLRLQRPFALRKNLQAQMPDAVLAFLEGPCFYSEVAGLPSRNWGLIVSERLQIGAQGFCAHWERLFHHLADYVTTNSYATRSALINMMPRLTPKIATIYNSLDLSAFTPASDAHPLSKEVRFVVVARYQPRKNILALVEAFALALGNQPSLEARVDCYGESLQLPNGAWDRDYFWQVQRAIERRHLQGRFHLHERDENIVERYREADALILPSLVEGLPNAVCEAMACGLGILASRIGDAEVLEQNGLNGFLFDPHAPGDIARAILQFCEQPPEARAEMGRVSRRKAETLFAPSSTVQAYATLLEAAAARRIIQLPHWPPLPSFQPQPSASNLANGVVRKVSQAA